MKIRDVRAVIVQFAASHERLACHESAASLRAFSEAMQEWDEQTVTAFVKLAKGTTRRPKQG
jgi:hypothetical protein